MDDWQLLQEYATRGSNDAFDALVRRHVDFVYSAALRQVQDRHLAEDVAQGVFVVLAEKAGALARQRPGVLAGWLFQVVRNLSANAVKRERRRRRHEARGGSMTPQATTGGAGGEDGATSADWATLAPHLDHALAGLGEGDRNAVLLRFFGGKSHRDVGAALGVSEEAARKRVDRAIDRLRRLLGRRGVAAPAAAVLGGLIQANGVQAAPAGLVVGAAGGAGGSLAEGAEAMMAWAKAKVVAGCVAAALAVAGAGGVVVRALGERRPVVAGGGAGAAPQRAPVVVVIDQPVAKPAQNAVIEGIVLGADGEPLADAEVYVATPRQPIDLHAQKRAVKPFVTGKEGTFALPRPAGAWQLVVIHEDGVAQLEEGEVAKSRVVVVRPWGRIEGRLTALGKALADEEVQVGEWPYAGDEVADCVRRDLSVRTDKDGRFAIATVAPGDYLVCQQKRGSWHHNNKWDAITIEPGKPLKLELGAEGRPVVGKVTAPAGWEGKIVLQPDRWHVATVSARRVDGQSGMPHPEGFETMTPQEQRAVRKRWDRTPEGRAHRRVMFAHEYELRGDGTFAIDALRPGTYSLTVNCRERDRVEPMLEDVASGETMVVVPEGNGQEPVDAGTVALKPLPRIAVGDQAPPLIATTLDGKPVKVADFEGKFLLLNVCYPYTQPELLAGLKQAHEAFATDPKFAMLTLHPRQAVADARALAAKHGLTWTQATPHADLPPGYLRGPANVFLIGPDGKVLAKVLHGKDVESVVAKQILEHK